MSVVHLIGTADTKSAELVHLRDLLRRGGAQVIGVDVGTSDPICEMEIPARTVAAYHPDGADAVLGGRDRGAAVSGMALAFARFCKDRRDEISAMIGIGGGGGTSIITAGMRTVPYGVPKVMVSTLAAGDVGPYVGVSDLIMMPSVTDIAGLNRISRQILHNAAQAVLGMAAHPYLPLEDLKPSIGLSMFGVTTPCITQITTALRERFDCVVFHATGTGGRSMEQLLSEGVLSGLIDITTTEISDEIVGGVLSAGGGRLDAVAQQGLPYVGSVGALDMVNFWAPDTVPKRFSDRQFYHHNPNVTLMRTTPEECASIGAWIAAKLNACDGPVRLLLPLHGISALDIEGGPFWNPAANSALFAALRDNLIQTENRKILELPHHINDPAFSAAAVRAFLDINTNGGTT